MNKLRRLPHSGQFSTRSMSNAFLLFSIFFPLYTNKVELKHAMMKNPLCALVILSSFLCQTFGGVVVEMISRDLRSNQESPPDKTYAQGRMLRIEPHPESGAPATGIYDASALRKNEAGFLGTVPNNAGSYPGVANFDFSLVKSTNIGERTKIQFRAEFFNIFNRTNFGLPNRQAFRSSGPNSCFGTITTTNTTNRQIQLGLKITF